jgi:hypothetical protein
LIKLPVTTAQKLLVGINYVNFLRLKVDKPEAVNPSLEYIAPNQELLQKYVSEFNISGKNLTVGTKVIPYASIKQVRVLLTDTLTPGYETVVLVKKGTTSIPGHALRGVVDHDILTISIYLDKDQIMNNLSASQLEKVIQYSVVFYLYSHTNGAVKAKDFPQFGAQIDNVQGDNNPLVTVITK